MSKNQKFRNVSEDGDDYEDGDDCEESDEKCFMFEADGNEEDEEDEVIEVDEEIEFKEDQDIISGNSKVVSNSYSADEYRAFKEIDRDQEDKLVCEFIKTKDSKTMLKLLNIREQTLRYMAKKYAYLDNEDDMYSIFKEVWLKCLTKYNGSTQSRPARNKEGNILLNEDGTQKMVDKKTPFNTYLYTSMKNRALNIFKKRNSKRLLDDNGRPVADSIRSLDYEYGDDEDMTLKNLIPDNKSEKAYSKSELSDLMRHLGTDKDPDIARAVDTFVNNSRFETLTAACNYRVGTLRINKWDKKVLNLGVAKSGIEPSLENLTTATNYLTQMVSSTGTFNEKYEIVSFVVQPNRVDFVVHMEDLKVVKKIKEAVLKCREALSQ